MTNSHVIQAKHEKITFFSPSDHDFHCLVDTQGCNVYSASLTSDITEEGILGQLRNKSTNSNKTP